MSEPHLSTKTLKNILARLMRTYFNQLPTKGEEMQKRTFTTKKKLSSTRAQYRPWKEWETGDYIIGKYKGCQTDNYDKPNWLFEIEECVFVKKPKLAKELIGKVLGLNSNGKLDKAMESATVGDFIQVTYNGTSMIEKGKYKGKEAHDVDVELVEEEGAEGAADEEEETEDDDL
jgi:hypothetical protein